IFVGLLVFLAHLFSALFARTRVPDVLPLLFLGLLAGPITNLVSPEAFGRLGNIFTTIALVMILFEGGIGLNFTALHTSILPGLRLTLISYFVSLIVVWGLSIYVCKISILEGLVLGSILGATAPAVVIPLSRQLRIQEATRTILTLEATLSEALCIVITLGFLQVLKYHELEPGLMVGRMIASFLLAAAIGAIFAFLWSSILKQVRRLENSMFLTPAFVFVIYGISEILGYSGAISALTFGVVLGNIKNLTNLPILKDVTSLKPVRLRRTEIAFFSEAVFLLKTFFFVYIGLSIRFSDPRPILIGLGLMAAIYIVRVPVIRLVIKKTTPRFDAAIASVMVPKGLAAAVLVSIPILLELKRGFLIQETVYSVIFFSIIATAVLSFIIEQNWGYIPYGVAFRNFAGGAEEKSDSKNAAQTTGGT
ncbi:MAG: cation:proton antiporter, partial [bacterium]